MRFTTHSINLNRVGIFGGNDSPGPMVPETETYESMQKDTIQRLQLKSTEELESMYESARKHYAESLAAQDRQLAEEQKGVMSRIQHELNQREIDLETGNRINGVI